MSPIAELTQRSLFKPETKEQKLAVCSGSLSLPPEDRVEVLAILTADADPQIAERAEGALLTQPVEHFVKALERADSDQQLFIYCARNLGVQSGIADSLAGNVGCPTTLVTRVAAHLTSSGIQALLDNLERFCGDTALVDAVSRSTAATVEQRMLLDELHKNAISMDEMEQAAAEIEPDASLRETMLQRVSHMSVVQRLMLALKGSRSERLLLIRDPNKLVQRSVLQSPRLSDSEVENFASISSLSAEVLRNISLMRIFMKNYAVVRNLVTNPKTPLDVSLHLFPRLTSTDLVKLTTNKNVPETLRSAATKLRRKRKDGAG